MKTKLFRDKDGQVKKMLSYVEGISYRESPLDFFILLARYKFAARLIKKTDKVLDAGCGHGHGTVFLSKFAKEVVGADQDGELVASNAEDYADIKKIRFTQLDLLDVSRHKQKYDAVVSMDVIEHFTQEQTVTVAQNYSRLVKKGGFAVIGTPNKASWDYASARRKSTHIHEFAPEEFETLLSRYFTRVFLFSMTDEVASLSFPKMAWYLMAICTK